LQNIVSFIGLFRKRDLWFLAVSSEYGYLLHEPRETQIGNKHIVRFVAQYLPVYLPVSPAISMLLNIVIIITLVWLTSMKTILCEWLICMRDSFAWVTHLYESLICMNDSCIWMTRLYEWPIYINDSHDSLTWMIHCYVWVITHSHEFTTLVAILENQICGVIPAIFKVWNITVWHVSRLHISRAYNLLWVGRLWLVHIIESWLIYTNASLRWMSHDSLLRIDRSRIIHMDGSWLIYTNASMLWMSRDSLLWIDRSWIVHRMSHDSFIRMHHCYECVTTHSWE